jgi:hypothetical protein
MTMYFSWNNFMQVYPTLDYSAQNDAAAFRISS